MAQWMGKLGFEFEIVVDCVFREVKKAKRVFADETTLPALAPGSGSTKAAYVWAYARVTEPLAAAVPAMVAYRFETAAPANARSGISMVIAVSCKWMAMSPITSLRYPKRCRHIGCLLLTQPAQVLRAACCRKLKSGNGDGRADGEALAGRENCAVKASTLALPRAIDLRGNRRRSLAANLQQIITG